MYLRMLNRIGYFTHFFISCIVFLSLISCAGLGHGAAGEKSFTDSSVHAAPSSDEFVSSSSSSVSSAKSDVSESFSPDLPVMEPVEPYRPELVELHGSESSLTAIESSSAGAGMVQSAASSSLPIASSGSSKSNSSVPPAVTASSVPPVKTATTSPAVKPAAGPAISKAKVPDLGPVQIDGNTKGTGTYPVTSQTVLLKAGDPLSIQLAEGWVYTGIHQSGNILEYRKKSPGTGS